MYAQTTKIASALALVGLMSFVAVQNQWAQRGGDALSELIAANGWRSAPAAAPALALAGANGANARAVYRSGQGVVEIKPDRNAQFTTDIEINGARIHALIDTGASHVVLTADDARAVNIDPGPSAYKVTAQTANGVAYLAPTKLRALRVGEITEYNVDALVAKPGQTGITLLGMSFLKNLSSFQVADGRFVMKQ
jgi:aspartyl protease family protein